MNQPKIDLIFPTPLFANELPRKFTQSELDFIDKYSKPEMTYSNYGNATSINTYVLHEPELKELHAFCLEQVKLYIDMIINPINKIEPFITQSWLNYTEKGGFHHKHNHPNSFLSGVIYINADESKDKINFYSSAYKQIEIAPKQYNAANSNSLWVSTKTGMIILFPSSLEHRVDKVESDQTRISLSFNTFIDGTLGDRPALTELFNVQQRKNINV
jgi:uncharacterized protein (TIGR02466 family)